MSSTVPIAAGPFEASWDSLRGYQCPEWFRDAKFGIWAHWGPQCVPMVGDWYARHMYVPGHPQYDHHCRVYGHPSKFGYKDIIELWKAEQFDPEGLMDLYQRAGATYFVAQAVHHDNFDNWDSKHHRWNSVNCGPRRNITRLWQDAAARRGMKFGVSEHLGASYSWWRQNKLSDPDGLHKGVPYDASDPQWADLYHDNADEPGNAGWYTATERWHPRWLARMMDLVDQHQPDLLYSDGGVPFGQYGLDLIAHLYNTSVKLHGSNQAVYNQKDTNPEVYSVGVLDIERGQLKEAAKEPWQTDTCVGGWYFDSRQKYKTPTHVIQMLVDNVAKNGNLLLNLTQMPDGHLDDQCLFILEKLAAWFAANGEGIYGTRPWVKVGEGTAQAEGGAFKENPIPYTSEDFRFTAKGDTVYAFAMKYPDTRQLAVRSLAKDQGCTIQAVKLLGCDADIVWEQADRALVARLPEAMVAPCVPCLAVTLA
ncbi:MAG: alpha-L-fucosidase [Armatimonadetes bacterium]|nr:alpha-L-fucosidase [Armatimonadota bacterium]